MSQLRKTEIGYDQLRSLVLEYLAECQDDPTLQFNDVRYRVGSIAARGGFLEAESQELSESDKCRACDVLWDLIIDGVLRPGDGHNTPPAANHFHVTDRGRELLKHGSMSPYDPDGYLKRWDSNVPDLDPVIHANLR